MKKRHSPLLMFFCLCTYLLNLFDLWYTLYALDTIPDAYEKNPFVRWMLRWPEAVVIYKYALLPLGLYLLYRNRQYRVAVWGIYLCTAWFGLTVLGQLLVTGSW